MGESNSVGDKFRQPCPAPEFVGLIRGRGRRRARGVHANSIGSGCLKAILTRRSRRKLMTLCKRLHADTPIRRYSPLLSRNLLISCSLIVSGLVVLAIHMLRTASETPISAAIRGMLWSEFSTNRVSSLKSLSSSDSSKAIASVSSSERNRTSTFRDLLLSIDAMPIVSSFLVLME
jgi:hypothetical protein